MATDAEGRRLMSSCLQDRIVSRELIITMISEFSEPPEGAKNRIIVEKRLEEVNASPEVGSSVTIEWRGKSQHLSVIQIEVDLLYYNPGTHRIRAQRSFEPARDQALSENPWSVEGQQYLHQLLMRMPSNPDRRDPSFNVLMQDIKNYGQNEPGIITQTGILVNGNTRRAALKELGRPYMSVAVLPRTTTWPDISAVELALQLRSDPRRKYSYINLLLALGEQADLGRSREDIAREFRIDPKSYDRDRWILDLIQDAIRRSRSSGAILHFVDFEDQREKFNELYRAYMKKALVDRSSAEMLKESRMLAIMLGFSKSKVRVIEENFQIKYLGPKLPAAFKPAGRRTTPAEIPGLGLLIPGEARKVEAARDLTDLVLQNRSAVAASGKLPDDLVAGAASTLQVLTDAVSRAVVSADREFQRRGHKQAALERLSAACDDIDQCVIDLTQIRAIRNLDESAFDELVVRLRESVSKLARQAARSIGEPGDGVAWLLDVTK